MCVVGVFVLLSRPKNVNAEKVFAGVDLRSASTYAVLAGSTIANTGLTLLRGNIGVSPGTAVTGFPPGRISAEFASHIVDSDVTQAKIDLSAAMLATSLLQKDVIWIGGTVDIGGIIMFPGVYDINTTLGILTGDLTLDAQGDFDATFIFKMVQPMFQVFSTTLIGGIHPFSN